MKRTRQNGRSAVAATRESPAHRFLIYKIGLLRRLLDRCSGPALTEQSGLTVAEWRVLTHLYGWSPITARQISLRVHADKAEISRACAGLIARGYATRRDDANDRRSALLAITPRGERLHDAIIPLRRAQQDALETLLTAREVAELRRLLDKWTAAVADRMSGAGAPAMPARRTTRTRALRATRRAAAAG
jgi:DNA-binding MarR family transcriptional regulator